MTTTVTWTLGHPPDDASPCWILVDDRDRPAYATYAVFSPSDDFNPRAAWMEARDWRAEILGDAIPWGQIAAWTPSLIPQEAMR
jgi:hypothetical protein